MAYLVAGLGGNPFTDLKESFLAQSKQEKFLGIGLLNFLAILTGIAVIAIIKQRS